MTPTRYFCCCLPVRLGVFLPFAVFSYWWWDLHSSSLVCVLPYVYTSFSFAYLDHSSSLFPTYAVSSRDDTVSLTTYQKFAYIASGIVNSILAVGSLMGLIGAIGRKRGLVATYRTFLWCHLVAQFAVGVAFIYALFQTNDTLVAQCKDRVSNINHAGNAANTGNAPVALADVCQLVFQRSRAGAIVSLIVMLIVGLNSCIIASRYVAQLSDEQTFRAVIHNSQFEASSGRGAGFYAHEPLQSGTELTDKDVRGHNGYPFA